jgi:glycosyltransferase involved in cell wall biosynthesis
MSSQLAPGAPHHSPRRSVLVHDNAASQPTRDRNDNEISHCILIVVPTLDAGAADAGAVALTRILAAAGHRPLVVSRPGRLVADVTAAGGEFIALNTATLNPATMLRRAATLIRLTRERRCIAIHALGRASAWSAVIAARLTGTPLVTSWYKGFREQNVFKRLYNRIMVSGDRVTAVSEQIAQLINDRYGTPWDRIAVVPAAIDLETFNPDHVRRDRVEALRRAWGVRRDTKVILVTGRILRRKGHHTVVQAARQLKERGVKNFLFVFVGEDRGHTHYTGELWDLVLATGTVDVIRMAAPVADMAAAYAAATVVVSAAIQPEGLQRAILEAQAMARPVIVSDLAAGTEVVLAEPSVPADRATGLRFPAGHDTALAAALIRLFAMPETARMAMGQRGRVWVCDHFNPETVAGQVLALYADVTDGRIAAPDTGLSAMN